MNLDDSPYRSPHLDDSGDPADGRVRILVWQMGAVLFAFLFYVLAYGLAWLMASCIADNSNINAPPVNPYWMNLARQLQPWVLILNPMAVLLGAVAVGLIWPHWEPWSGVLIVVLLSLIPVVSLLVLSYSLVKGANTIRDIQRANLRIEKATA